MSVSLGEINATDSQHAVLLSSTVGTLLRCDSPSRQGRAGRHACEILREA